MTEKKIELSKKDKEALKATLEGKLARKEVVEKQLSDVSEGGSAYWALIHHLKDSLKGMGAKSLLYVQRVVEIRELEFKAQKFVNDYRVLRREYEYYLLPEIQEICSALDMETDGIEFKDMEKVGADFVKTRIFRETNTLPENVEHSRMLSFYNRHIQLRENLVLMIEKAIEKEDDELKIARLQVERYDEYRHLQTLLRRYEKRMDYHNNKFLPAYNADMEECAIYLEKYLQRAKELSSIDPTYRLRFMLEEYEANKNDSEKLWLFYTTLRSRIDEMTDSFNENPEQFKDKLHLLKPVRNEKEKGKSKELSTEKD
jgi:hypothetical protein